VFSEPLGSNPIINLFRAITPEMRTVDEHPLLKRDLKLLEEYFENVETDCFTLCTLLAVPFRNTRLFARLHRILAGVDRVIFRVPLLDRLAWMVVIHAYNPRK
jgi:hypothetical protein